MNATTAELSLRILVKQAQYELTRDERWVLGKLFDMGAYISNTRGKKAKFGQIYRIISCDVSRKTINTNTYAQVDEALDQLIEVFHHCRPTKFDVVSKKFLG